MSMEDTVNILIVDDDPKTLLSYEAVLDGLGLNIVKAGSGKEALKCLLDQDFALILLDVSMPDIDGFETARLIRRRPRLANIPIIFITGVSTTDMDTLKRYWVGAGDYLYKPVVPEILRAKVIAFIDIFRMSQKIREQANQLQDLNHKLEQEVKDVNSLNQQLEAANRELEAFSYTLTHDLRSSITGIFGFTEMLLEEHPEELSENTAEYLGIIHNMCQNMTNIINAVLILSQISHKDMEYKEINLTSLAFAISSELRAANPDRRVDFLIHEGIACKGDPNILLIVLNNLINNAWKYTSKQSEAKIEIGSIQEESGRIVYFVRDNGVGFDGNSASKLFIPFQRLHSKEEFQGFGIGLATVHRAIKRHNGNVWADGERDKGATFYFTLANGENAACMVQR